MKLRIAFFVLLATSLSFSQTLLSGGISLVIPVYGAFEFDVFGGGPGGVTKCPPQSNGFCYENGEFHLIDSGSGACSILAKGHASCQFDGDIAPNAGLVTHLDNDCEQLSFPITNGKLQLETRDGLEIHSQVKAIYSQMFCNLDEDETSVFGAGGSLIVYVPGFVPGEIEVP